MSEQKGLYNKYTVVDNETGKEVEDCFILKPENDPCARGAIETYAILTEDRKLARMLRLWMDNLS